MTLHLVYGDLNPFSELLQARGTVFLSDILPPAKLCTYCDHLSEVMTLGIREYLLISFITEIVKPRSYYYSTELRMAEIKLYMNDPSF
jgi:hypothetical protein